jgi:hypothetical protein
LFKYNNIQNYNLPSIDNYLGLKKSDEILKQYDQPIIRNNFITENYLANVSNSNKNIEIYKKYDLPKQSDSSENKQNTVNNERLKRYDLISTNGTADKYMESIANRENINHNKKNENSKKNDVPKTNNNSILAEQYQMITKKAPFHNQFINNDQQQDQLINNKINGQRIDQTKWSPNMNSKYLAPEKRDKNETAETQLQKTRIFKHKPLSNESFWNENHEKINNSISKSIHSVY